MRFGTSLISSFKIAECDGSLGNPYALLSPLNSFNTSMLSSLGFSFSYTSITSAKAGNIFLIILYGLALNMILTSHNFQG